MLTIEIVNDGSHTNRPAMGNYDYRVLVNCTVIASGRVENHNRRQGWTALVSQIIEKHPEAKAANTEGPIWTAYHVLMNE